MLCSLLFTFSCCSALLSFCPALSSPVFLLLSSCAALFCFLFCFPSYSLPILSFFFSSRSVRFCSVAFCYILLRSSIISEGHRERGGVVRPHVAAPLHPRLADAVQRWHAPAAAVELLLAEREGRQHRRHLRHPQAGHDSDLIAPYRTDRTDRYPLLPQRPPFLTPRPDPLKTQSLHGSSTLVTRTPPPRLA